MDLVTTQRLDTFLAPGPALLVGRRYSAMDARGTDTRSPSLTLCMTLMRSGATTLTAAGTPYRAPSVKMLEGPVVTACGPAGPEHLAFYCPAEEAIYYSPAGLDEHCRRIGDFAPIVVMAHEWGHHLQTLLGIDPSPGNTFELQADCLAGAYASDAGQRGLLDPGDITEAVAMAATVGDPLGLPQDELGAHGINDDRITAFMRGYLGGVDACNCCGLNSGCHGMATA